MGWGRLGIAANAVNSASNGERQCPTISEFSASNDNAIDDGFGNSSDWIEIYNRGDTGIDLAGYRLTDNLGNLGKWPFPSVYLDAGAFLLVFASGAYTLARVLSTVLTLVLGSVGIVIGIGGRHLGVDGSEPLVELPL